MSEEIEKLISEIMDADEIEILEFDFEPIFSKLRTLKVERDRLEQSLLEPMVIIEARGYGEAL